jgi:SnoaL-like domain
MIEPKDVVRIFHERMEDRDWDGAAELLSPTIDIHFPATGERFVGDGYLASNREYPEGWAIEIIEVLGHGDRVASHIRVRHGEDSFVCSGFYTVRDGLIIDGVENWLTSGAEVPPTWRARFTVPNDLPG